VYFSPSFPFGKNSGNLEGKEMAACQIREHRGESSGSWSPHLMPQLTAKNLVKEAMANVRVPG
jgi:hypothetical protein